MESDRLYGVYRARVIDIGDPQKKGRLHVHPITGLGEAMAVWAPAVKCQELADVHLGDIVLVAFENGNPIYPIVLGLLEYAASATPADHG